MRSQKHTDVVRYVKGSLQARGGLWEGERNPPREDGFSFPHIDWLQTGLFIFDITDHQTWKVVGVCSYSLR